MWRVTGDKRRANRRKFCGEEGGRDRTGCSSWVVVRGTGIVETGGYVPGKPLEVLCNSAGRGAHSADDDPAHRSRLAAACSTGRGCGESQGISVGRTVGNSVRKRVARSHRVFRSGSGADRRHRTGMCSTWNFPSSESLHRHHDVLPAGPKHCRSGLCATDSSAGHRKIAEMHRPYHSDGLRVKSEPAIIRPIHFSDRFVRSPAYGIHHAFSHRI